MQAPAGTLLAELVKLDANAGGKTRHHDSKGGGAVAARTWAWESVVKGLIEGGDVKNENGLCIDFLASVNPLLWSHPVAPAVGADTAARRGGASRGVAAGRRDSASAEESGGVASGEDVWKLANDGVLECVFALHRTALAAEGDDGNADAGLSRYAALAGPLIQLGGVAGGKSLRLCREWLLRNAFLDRSNAMMRRVGPGRGGGNTSSAVLDCSLCLQVLSTCMTGESGPIEGTWGEGGGGEVSEIRTRRENMGLSTRVSARVLLTLRMCTVQVA